MDIKQIMESLLFASGEPLSISKFVEITGKGESEIKSCLKILAQELKDQKRGINLIEKDNQWLMVSAPESSVFVQKMKRETREGNLSDTCQEILAIIAYQGPITRSEINEIRGVDSSYSLNQLLSRALIERFPHPKRTNTYLYNISFEFLKHLGINNVKDLVQYDEFHRNSPFKKES